MSFAVPSWTPVQGTVLAMFIAHLFWRLALCFRAFQGLFSAAGGHFLAF
jgi:hypothetical protein